MGLGIAEKIKYSKSIEINIRVLEEITPSDFYIPIKQVAYRFNLDKDEMYLDFPYNEKVEKQNHDLNYHPKIKGVDNDIFQYLNSVNSNVLKYILYEYKYESKEKPIICSIISSIPNYKESVKIENIRKAFSIIHYNATGLGHYLDDIKYVENKNENNLNRLLFVLDGFAVDCVLTKEKRFSYLNITFKLSESHDINDEKTSKVLKHLLYNLKLFGETLLIYPLSEEKKEDEMNRRLKEKIRDDSHTILNFLYAINHKTKLIEDKQLRLGSEILFRLLEDVVTEENDRPTVWKKHGFDNPTFILEKLTEYFNGDNSKRLNLDYQHSGESNFVFNGMQGYAYLTIMYNLIHNAHKSRIYETYNESATSYRVVLSLSDKRVSTHIITPALINKNILSFLSNELTVEDSGMKKSGGIAISKKLANQNGWTLTATNDRSKIENKFTLEIQTQ